MASWEEPDTPPSPRRSSLGPVPDGEAPPEPDEPYDDESGLLGAGIGLPPFQSLRSGGGLDIGSLGSPSGMGTSLLEAEVLRRVREGERLTSDTKMPSIGATFGTRRKVSDKEERQLQQVNEAPGPQTLTMTVERGVSGLGLVLDDENYVTHLLPGCAAEEAGEIFEGDQLLAVDGVDVQVGDKVSGLFPITKGSFEVQVRRNNDGELRDKLKVRLAHPAARHLPRPLPAPARTPAHARDHDMARVHARASALATPPPSSPRPAAGPPRRTPPRAAAQVHVQAPL